MKNNKGFSLVELIVVIAIMAILAAVAVIGVSVYIPKAQQASDRQTINDIEYALELHAQSTPENVAAGYVILTPTGAQATEGFVTDVLVATYGNDWVNELKLAYDKWEVNNVLPSLEAAQSVANSSYYKYNTPSELVNSFSALTDSLSTMAATAGSDPLDVMAGLDYLTEDEVASLREELGDLTWEGDKEAYSTAVSNLLVKKTATEIGNPDKTVDDYSAMSELAWQYAMIYGWASNSTDGADILKGMNTTITSGTASSQEVVKAVSDAFTQANQSASFAEYMNPETGSFANDTMGLTHIMGTVGDWSADADMTTSGLYSSNSIVDAVNSYTAAVDVVKGLSPEEQQQWDTLIADTEKGIIVFVTSTGEIICTLSE